MKALYITQEIKDKNPSFRIYGLGLRIFTTLPSRFNGIENIGGYYETHTDKHEADGFWDVEKLPLQQYQRHGALERKGTEKLYHYPIIDFTQEEIDVELENKISNYRSRINSYFSQMYTRALSSSMNKSSSDLNYLLGLREEYQDKYNVSKGIVTEGVTYDATLFSIQGEMEDEFTEVYLDTILPTYGLETTGTHLEKMFRLIVFKFEYGLNSFNEFNKFIRRFRTKCIVWLDNSNFNNLDSAFSIVDSLPDELSVSDAEILYNEFNNL